MPTAVITAMDRLSAVVNDPAILDVIGQKVMEGMTLKQIAREWELPVMRFITWVVEDLSRLQVYQAALKVRADEMAHQTISIADGVDETRVVKDDDGTVHVLEPDVKRDNLRVRTRMTLASHYDRERFGQHTEQKISVKRGLAAEYTDAELLALIQNAERDAKAIEHRSELVLEQATQVGPFGSTDGVI